MIFTYLSNTGDHVFFNDREAQTIAELFIEEKEARNNRGEELIGTWDIQTTSLRDKKTKGKLHLSLNADVF